MKKTTKKLVLSRETVRNLKEPALRRADGGDNSLRYGCITSGCPTSNGPYLCQYACIEP